MTVPILSAESLGKRFGHRQVLKGASFQARSGRITAIMGRNGCGKSTLLDMVAGWRSPDFGAVHFAGRVWERPRLHQMARLGLFYLPQRPPLSSSFRLGVYFDAVVRRFGSDALDRAVEMLRLTDLMDLFPHMLSGGEKVRAAIGLAMARRPTCLLVDEPFARIAPLDQEVIGSALTRLADQGTAVVVTGHDVPILFDLAAEVIWVVAGTTMYLGSPAEAGSHERFRREYLGPSDLSERP